MRSAVHPSRGRQGRLIRVCVLGACLSAFLPSGGQVHADSAGGATLFPETKTDPLAALGSVLFGARDLSRDGSVSCSTCHVPELGFSGGQPLATGVGGHQSRRRAPALSGLRSSGPFMWDGRAATLSELIPMPLESKEMDVDWASALRALNRRPEVQQLASASDLGELDRNSVVKALATYLATLEARPTRFDRYYYGRDSSALSEQEAWGLRLFVRKARCATCHLLNAHSAPFTDGAFHATGVGASNGIPVDAGRARVTGSPADEGRFKTPGLRGVTSRPYLMHDGSFLSLTAVVEFYNRGAGQASLNCDPRLQPLHLSVLEIEAVVAFLHALSTDGGSID